MISTYPRITVVRAFACTATSSDALTVGLPFANALSCNARSLAPAAAARAIHQGCFKYQWLPFLTRQSLERETTRRKQGAQQTCHQVRSNRACCCSRLAYIAQLLL